MLNGSQARVLDFIIESIHQDEIAPTFREIAEVAGLSQSGARFIVMQLESLGYLRRREHKFRAIKVLKLPDEAKAA